MYDLKVVLNELKFLIHWNMIWFIFPDLECQLIIKNISYVCEYESWNSVPVYRLFCCSSKTGVYFEMRSRKSCQLGYLCTALRCTAAARSHVQCLTKPPWFDCASRTCAAVMAARESEEDNKWTAEKRLKGETEKMTSCSVTTATFSTSRPLSCLRWLLVYLARRCVCVVRNLVEFLDGTRTYTHAGQ